MDIVERENTSAAAPDRSQLPAGGNVARGTRRRRAGLWLVAAVYALAMLGGTLPVPLYVYWAPEMGFGPFTTTLIFAVYAVGVVVSLLVFAPWSDRSGRRPSLAVSIAVIAASTLCFLLAHDVATLMGGRFLSGLATGVVTAGSTAALEELAGADGARRASTIATAANLGGLGLGAVIAGLFAQLTADPTRLVFWVYLGALVPALLAVIITPETVTAPGRPTLSVRRPEMPASPSDRIEFACAAGSVFAVFAVNGLFTSLVPAFLHDRLHVVSVAVVGAVVALLFAVALAAQIFAPATWLQSPYVAPAFIVGGVTVFETGLWAGSAAVFVVGTVLAGIGAGLAFRHGVMVTARLAEPNRRANLFASFFLAAYCGLIVPTLALGLLDEVIDQNFATLILTIGVGATVIAAALVRIRRAHRGDQRPSSGNIEDEGTLKEGELP